MKLIVYDLDFLENSESETANDKYRDDYKL